jgi:hypothetical protein
MLAPILFSLNAGAQASQLLEVEGVRDQTPYCSGQDQGLSQPFDVDGQSYQIRLPICYNTVNNMYVTGIADADLLDQYLAPLGLYAQRVIVPIMGPGAKIKLYKGGIVQLFTLDYRRSTIGTYQEGAIVVAATPKKRGAIWLPTFLRGVMSQKKVSPDFGYLIAKLWVNTDAALSAGNTLWKYNKELADIVMDNDSAPGRDYGFSVSEPNGTPVFATRWAQIPTRSNLIMDAFGANFHFTSYSPLEKGYWSEFKSHGEAGTYTKVFNPAKDTLELNPGSEWGNRLIQWKFKPLTKSLANGFHAMLFMAYKAQPSR